MTAFFIGDVALDEYYAAECWPGVADKDFIYELPAECGGSIANAAVVHAALGGATDFISLLKESALSERLIADLNANGVATGPMLRQPGFLYTALYRARRLRKAEGNLGQVAPLVDLRGHGRQLVFDLDVGGATVDDLEKTAEWRRANEIARLVRTVAAERAEALDGDRIVRAAGHRVRVVDVTGAGDTFGAALTWGLAVGRSFHTAFRLRLPPPRVRSRAMARAAVAPARRRSMPGRLHGAGTAADDGSERRCQKNCGFSRGKG